MTEVGKLPWVNSKKATFQYGWNIKHNDISSRYKRNKDFPLHITKQYGMQLLKEKSYGMQKNK